jgi:hypothetical protein
MNTINTLSATAALMARPLGLPEIQAKWILRVLNNDGNVIVRNILSMEEYGVDFTVGAWRCAIRKLDGVGEYEFARLKDTGDKVIVFNRKDLVGEGRLTLKYLLEMTFRSW